MNQRRLDAEATRDAILAVSGTLNLKAPGGSLATLAAAPAGKTKVAGTQRESDHRSVYLGIVRGAPLPEALALFDVANPDLIVAQREVTTMPSQALYLMNSPFVVEQAKHAAGRLLTAPDLNDAGRIDLAYRLALARPATAAERNRVLAYIAQMTKDLTGRDKNAAQTAWASFCQVMFASAEFRYVR